MSKSSASSNRLTRACPSRNFAGPVALANQPSISGVPALVHEHFDLRPKGIIQMLDLLRPIYSKTAAYGHFGRDEPNFTWERTNMAATLCAAAGLK